MNGRGGRFAASLYLAHHSSLLTQKRQFLSETPLYFSEGKKCLNLTVSDAFPFMPRVGCQAEVSLSLSGKEGLLGEKKQKRKRCISKRFRKRRRKRGRRREINFVSLAKLLAEEEEEEKGEKEEDAREMKRGKSFLSDGQRNPSSCSSVLTLCKSWRRRKGEGGNLPGQPTIQPGIFLPSLPLGFSDIHRRGSPSNPKK